MLQRRSIACIRQLSRRSCSTSTNASTRRAIQTSSYLASRARAQSLQPKSSPLIQRCSFHATPTFRAQGPTADALMDNLTDLYSTAKDEFEIAAEETEKKTVYAADDREAAKEALDTLKAAYERALKESEPDVAKEVQSRTGPRIRELENAFTAMEEMAMED